MNATLNEKKIEKPAQDKLNVEITILQQEILLLEVRKKANLLTEKEERILKKKKENLTTKEKALKYRKRSTARNQKYRAQKRQALESLCVDNPEIKKKLKI